MMTLRRGIRITNGNVINKNDIDKILKISLLDHNQFTIKDSGPCELKIIKNNTVVSSTRLEVTDGKIETDMLYSLPYGVYTLVVVFKNNSYPSGYIDDALVEIVRGFPNGF